MCIYFFSDHTFYKQKIIGNQERKGIFFRWPGKRNRAKRLLNAFDRHFFVSFSFTAAPVIVQAEKSDIHFQDYIKTIYNNTNGLPSSEANAIAETEDGYIWIGGYAGLTRYDGTRFEYITEGGLAVCFGCVRQSRGLR